MPELQNQDQEMLDTNITIKELYEAMKLMDTKKSPGTDGLIKKFMIISETTS